MRLSQKPSPHHISKIVTVARVICGIIIPHLLAAQTVLAVASLAASATICIKNKAEQPSFALALIMTITGICISIMCLLICPDNIYIAGATSMACLLILMSTIPNYNYPPASASALGVFAAPDTKIYTLTIIIGLALMYMERPLLTSIKEL